MFASSVAVGGADVESHLHGDIDGIRSSRKTRRDASWRRFGFGRGIRGLARWPRSSASVSAVVGVGTVAPSVLPSRVQCTVRRIVLVSPFLFPPVSDSVYVLLVS